MRVAIDVSDKTYNEIMDEAKNSPRDLNMWERKIAEGTPVSEGSTENIINTSFYIKDIGKRSLDVYGAERQIDMCIEDMSELIRALITYKKSTAADAGTPINPIKMSADDTVDFISEKMADTLIMLDQMRMIFKNEKTVSDWMLAKTKRQEVRLELRNKSLADYGL